MVLAGNQRPEVERQQLEQSVEKPVLSKQVLTPLGQERGALSWSIYKLFGPGK